MLTKLEALTVAGYGNLEVETPEFVEVEAACNNVEDVLLAIAIARTSLIFKNMKINSLN